MKRRVLIEPLSLSDVAVDLPLYEDFLNIGIQLDVVSGKGFVSEFGSLDIIFELLTGLHHSGYYCTPLNALTFARTGVDGEHFSFLITDDVVNARSPVIVTAPCSYGGPKNIIVAKDFRMFLQLWIRFGGCPLVDLAFSQDHALKVYTDAKWQPADKTAENDYNQGDKHRAVLDSVAKKLNLQPYIYTMESFNDLQQRYLPLLQMPAKYNEEF